MAAGELSKAVPRAGGAGADERGQGLRRARSGSAPQLLLVLGAEGRVVRGRPTGGWTSSRHRWVPLASWLGHPIPDLPVEEARAELVRRWLDRFGPGTIADLKWWTGWSLGHTRAALADLDVETVDLDGEEGIVLAGDTHRPSRSRSWRCCPDSTPPRWAGSSATGTSATTRPPSSTRTGNAGPTVWVDGRIVGGWAQRKTGEVVFRLLEDIGRGAGRRGRRREADLEQLLRRGAGGRAVPRPARPGARRR